MEEIKSPDRNELILNYHGTGVKTLRGFAAFMVVLAILAPIGALLPVFNGYNMTIFLCSLGITLQCIILRAIFLALALITETHILKRSELLRNNKIVDSDTLTPEQIIEMQGRI